MRDHFNLDDCRLGQCSDLDGGPRGEIGCEIFGVDFIHPGKVAEVVRNTVLLTTLEKLSF